MKSFEQIATETHNDIETVRTAVRMSKKSANGWVCDGYQARTRQAAVKTYLTRHISEPIEIWSTKYIERLAPEHVARARAVCADNVNVGKLTGTIVAFGVVFDSGGSYGTLDTIRADNIGEIVGKQNPYRGMSEVGFYINVNAELEWVGAHDCGHNTIIYREWWDGDIPGDISAISNVELRARTRALGPDILANWGLLA